MHRHHKIFFTTFIVCVTTLTYTIAVDNGSYPQMMVQDTLDIGKQAAGNLFEFQFYYFHFIEKFTIYF